MTECPTCGRECAKTAHRCPHCGGIVRSWFWWYAAVGFVVVVVVVTLVVMHANKQADKCANERVSGLPTTDC